MTTVKKRMIRQQEVKLSLLERQKRISKLLLKNNEKERNNVKIVKLKNNLKYLREEIIAKQHREKISNF